MPGWPEEQDGGNLKFRLRNLRLPNHGETTSGSKCEMSGDESDDSFRDVAELCHLNQQYQRLTVLFFFCATRPTTTSTTRR